MKSTQSEKRPYKSFFKEGYVTEANYIVELIFKKRFEELSKESCPQKFWNDDSQKGPYRGQIIAASRLLKKYHGSSIIKAIKSPKAKYIFKLQDPKLKPIIESFESTYKETEVIKTEKKETKHMKPFGKSKNRLSDL